MKPASPPTVPSRRLPRWEVGVVLAALAVHAALAVWGIAANSVTFDENFHLPAGVRILTRADFATSFAQPPLAKAVFAIPALLAGAHLPDDMTAGPGNEVFVGLSFLRENAGQFHRVFAASRLVAVVCSLVLAWMVWREARRRFGAAGGLIALGAFAFAPEALAHAGFVGVDLPTALTMFGACLTWTAFVRFGRLADGLKCAAWTAAAFLVRFSAVQLLPAFGLILLAALALGRARRPARAWAALALMPLFALLVVNAGYLFQGTFKPLGQLRVPSDDFVLLQRRFPNIRLPLPEAYVQGLDYLRAIAKPGSKASYVLGQVRYDHVWWYFPLTIAVKWPIGLLALLVARLAASIRAGRRRRERFRDLALLLPASVVLGMSMLANLDYGVRYVFPMLPFLCVWVGGLAAARGQATRARRAPALAWVALGAVLVAGEALEMSRALPWPLTFFNAFAGGPGRGEWLVNDSNVDWGQGLIALRDEMSRLKIGRVHLAYHGTTDPAVYGIDYVTYTGGVPGPEADWLAVSSYYFVGLPARMTTNLGVSKDLVTLDFQSLWNQIPVSRPGHCMRLYRVR